MGNFGGIAGSNIYVASEKPKCPAGFGTGLGVRLAAVIAAYFLRLAFARENDKRRKMMEEEGEAAVSARYSEQELLQMGDRSPFFTYTL